MSFDWKQRPEIVVLRERARIAYQTAWKQELERRKVANLASSRPWEVKPGDYDAADDAGFDALWRELMRGKDFICGETGG